MPASRATLNLNKTSAKKNYYDTFDHRQGASPRLPATSAVRLSDRMEGWGRQADVAAPRLSASHHATPPVPGASTRHNPSIDPIDPKGRSVIINKVLPTNGFFWFLRPRHHTNPRNTLRRSTVVIISQRSVSLHSPSTTPPYRSTNRKRSPLLKAAEAQGRPKRDLAEADEDEHHPEVAPAVLEGELAAKEPVGGWVGGGSFVGRG